MKRYMGHGYDWRDTSGNATRPIDVWQVGKNRFIAGRGDDTGPEAPNGRLAVAAYGDMLTRARKRSGIGNGSAAASQSTR